MPAMSPNNLPPEIVHKIIRTSLGPIETFDTLAYAGKLRFLRICCLVCRSWFTVSQAFLFENVRIGRSKTFFLFWRTITSRPILGKYVRKLSLGIPIWDDVSPYPITKGLGQIIKELEDLEDLEIRPPFCELVDETVMDTIRFSTRLKKLTIKRFSGSQTGNLTKTFRKISEKDHLCTLVLPRTIQHVNLTQPSNDFMNQLPRIFSNHLESTHTYLMTYLNVDSPPKPIVPSASIEGLRSFSLHLADPRNANMLDNLIVVISSTLTSFSFCLNVRMDDQMIIQLIALLPNLESLKLGRIGLSPLLFRNLKPLRLLKSLSLTACGPMPEDVDLNVDWLGFCHTITSFIEQSPLLESFEFDTGRSPHNVFIGLLLELLFVTTFDSSRTHSRLKHLTIKHTDPPPMSSIEMICDTTPLLKSLSIRVPIRNLARLRVALSKLNQLERLELNSFVMVKHPFQKAIDMDPFFRFYLHQNYKRQQDFIF